MWIYGIYPCKIIHFMSALKNLLHDIPSCDSLSCNFMWYYPKAHVVSRLKLINVFRVLTDTEKNNCETGLFRRHSDDNVLIPYIYRTSSGIMRPKKLTHLSLDKMATILQTTFSSTLSWMKSFVSLLEFHWNLFPLMIKLAIIRQTSNKPLSGPMLTLFTDTYMWH